MNITFKPIVVHRRKDGTCPVSIRVTFRGVSRRLPTNLVARPSDLTRSRHIKSPDILNRAEILIAQMRGAASALSPFVIRSWDIDRVVAYIQAQLAGQDFRLNFFDYADRYLTRYAGSTLHAYQSSLRALERFVGGRELDVNDITKALLLAWRDDMASRNKMYYRAGVWKETSKPQGGGQATRHLNKVEHIFRAAKTEYNDDDRVLIPRNPFDGIPKVVPPAKGQRNLGPELMQRIILSDATGAERTALDIFVLSFVTFGANMADLWAARSAGPEWVYNRAKTKKKRQDEALMRVEIQPEAEKIIGRLQTGPAGWWLPALHGFAGSCNKCTAKVNRYLRKWADREGVKPFTFYAARKTWASIARRIGIEKALVDECLVHIGDFRLTDIYAERSYEQMNAANRKVLDLFRWP